MLFLKDETEISRNSIRFVELGITNKCNLRCPLCIQSKKKLYTQPALNVDIDQLVGFLDKLPNLERINFEGNYSEPLLYSDFLPLIKYLKKRNLKIIISTNASIENEKLWMELGSLLKEKDIVRFAIDGSSQELYSKYRVGGCLDLVLKNHSYLKRHSKCRTVLQNIVFNYNHLDQEDLRELFVRENFDYLNFTKCYMGEFADEDIAPVDDLKKYYKLFNRPWESSKGVALCDSKRRGEVYINHKGEIFLCGSHDQGDSLRRDGVGIMSSEEEIFEFLNSTYNHRNESSVCKSDCNILCYSVGRRFPDFLIEKNGNQRAIHYFAKDIDEDHSEIDDIISRVAWEN